MRIRRMTREDLSQVVEIENLTFSQPWSEQGFVDSLSSKDTVFLVAEETVANSCGNVCDWIVGYIGMYVSFEEGEITNVAVRETVRKQGIGNQLLKAVLEEGIKAGVTRFVLEVRVSNQPAVRLYQKHGFVTAGIRPDFYELPKENAWIMVREMKSEPANDR